MGLKHAFSSSIPDGADASLVRPSDWNAEHIAIGLDVHGQKVTTVADPSEQYDAANKNNVDLQTGGWDDIQGPAIQGTGIAALTQESYGSTTYQAYFMRYDQQDRLSYAFQMPHSWDPTSDVKFHLHVVPMGTPLSTQTFTFTGSYTWSSIASALPTSGWTAFSCSHQVTTTSALTQSIVSMFTATPPSGSEESSFLLVTFNRGGVAGGTGDTYNAAKAIGTGQANICFLGADVHFKKNKAGTLNAMPNEGTAAMAASSSFSAGSIAAGGGAGQSITAVSAASTVATVSASYIAPPARALPDNANTLSHIYIDSSNTPVDVTGLATLSVAGSPTYGTTGSFRYQKGSATNTSYIRASNDIWPKGNTSWTIAALSRNPADQNTGHWPWNTSGQGTGVGNVYTRVWYGPYLVRFGDNRGTSYLLDAPTDAPTILANQWMLTIFGFDNSTNTLYAQAFTSGNSSLLSTSAPGGWPYDFAAEIGDMSIGMDINFTNWGVANAAPSFAELAVYNTVPSSASFAAIKDAVIASGFPLGQT